MEVEMLEDTTQQYFTIARNVTSSRDPGTWLWIDHSSNGRFSSEHDAVSEANRLTRTMADETDPPYFAVRITEIRMVESVDGKP